ncbi:NgoMIV family type II restriction endonuclease [Dermatophilaceae bacterium Soc4.6]
MPAAFAVDLCGFRDGGTGAPNTSDVSEKLLVELGRALFAAMGVPPGQPAPNGVDKQMSRRLADDLGRQIGATDLEVQAEQALDAFTQYRHVSAIKGFRAEPTREVTTALTKLRTFVTRRITTPPRDVTRRDELLEALDTAMTAETVLRRQVIDDLGEESLLNLDVTASRAHPGGKRHLEAGLSLKWSLRTDRARDCRSQGGKMASLRRGMTPHFAAVTMEPRPYMLRLLGGGSGEVDCVYHLDLPSLTTAIETVTAGNPRRKKTPEQLRRLVDQRRLRYYDELVTYIGTP